MSEKIIRDPVHDVIAFRLDRASDRLLFKLLGAIETQRLRRVRQLGMAHLAYPGADHSRYSHSLGVMQTARRMLEHLARGCYIPAERELDCCAAALLHDVGHGPLSHVFERVTGIHHEEFTRRIILGPDTEVHQFLSSHDSGLPQRVVALLAPAPPRTYLSDVLSSQLDADRLDYLLRDNLMTGSKYGDYDLTWLLHALTIDEATGRLVITLKGISAVEAYLQSRFHMYRNVYFHKVVRSAEGMLRLTLQRARDLAASGSLPWPAQGGALRQALAGEALSVAGFIELDDVSLTYALKVWSESDDAVLSELSRGLLFRRLFKTIDLSGLEDPAEARHILEAVTRAVSSDGGQSQWEVFFDEPSETRWQSAGSADDDEILVRQTDGRLCHLASMSPMIAAMDRELMFRRICVSPRFVDVARQTVERYRLRQT
ncbi:MAG: HD domain-containing protein [Tepidisphaeraceae bacterium]